MPGPVFFFRDLCIIEKIPFAFVVDACLAPAKVESGKLSPGRITIFLFILGLGEAFLFLLAGVSLILLAFAEFLLEFSRRLRATCLGRITSLGGGSGRRGRRGGDGRGLCALGAGSLGINRLAIGVDALDRKSTRLNSSH